MRLVTSMALGLAMLGSLAASGATPSRTRTEADLKAVEARIERVRQQVQRDAEQKDRLSRDLRAAEQSVAGVRSELSRLRDERTQRNAAREKLDAERAERESARNQMRQDLAEQIRAAYIMGRHEPLKLLLNQRNPAQFGRNLAYYGYFGRLRASQIGEINANLAKIDELKAKIEEEDAELRRIEEARQQRLTEMEKARRLRGRVLANLEKESRSRSATLARLQTQQTQLERLLRELSRAVESESDPNDVFAKLRGKLAWPVAGHVASGFGDTRAGGVKWNGLMIDADQGATVKAVHDGRVMFADWLSGFGLLIILDHGNGYMSVYGHNEQLFKKADAQVKAGESIAAAGDSGGRSQTGLYFEIRRRGKPVDPRPWFRSGAPPAK
jgi:murein hydrolase activator